jgi:hypothetical protein
LERIRHPSDFRPCPETRRSAAGSGPRDKRLLTRCLYFDVFCANSVIM